MLTRNRKIIIICILMCIGCVFTACKKVNKEGGDSGGELTPTATPSNESSQPATENQPITAESQPNTEITEASTDDQEVLGRMQNDSMQESNPELFQEEFAGSGADKPVTGNIVNESSDVQTVFIKGDGVRLREQPSTEAEVLMSLNYGEAVERLNNDGSWSKVKFKGYTGYVRNDLISDTKSEHEEEVASIVTSLSDPKIIIKKEARVLELWDGDSLYDSYRVGLGREPVGDKKKEGDGRTPEGTYYICTRNDQSRFYLSLGVSYPNKEDAKEALNSALIDDNTYRQIAEAIDNKAQPPWNTPLGGEIMIHGHGADSDWTAGCIAVDNEVMDILWKYCPMNTPIIIQP